MRVHQNELMSNLFLVYSLNVMSLGFPELDTIIAMVNWWIVWINKDIILELGREYNEVGN